MSQIAATCMTGGCMTGAGAVVASLASQGIDHIFGVPGGHTVPLFDALWRQGAIG